MADKMKRHLLPTLVLISIATAENINGQMTIGALRSVYLIKYNNSLGTCFNLSVDGNQYLITAAHVLEGMKDRDTIGIFTVANQWQHLSVRRIPISSVKSDIAILIPTTTLDTASLEIGSLANREFPTELYFMGFPHGGNISLKVSDTTAPRTFRLFSVLSGSPYPAALIKRGIMSGTDTSDPTSVIIFIDAMNNPGFSGGPVLVYDQQAKKPKVIGVVSARIPERVMTAPGFPELPISSNAGIVIAHHISPAVSAIQDFVKNGFNR